MALAVITPPTAEPLDLSEVKLHSRVDADVTDEDTLFRALLGAARGYAENITQKQIVSATYKQVLDSFPGYDATYAPYGRTYGFPPNGIKLQVWPVQQIVSIQYLDMSGAVQTVDPATYTIDYTSEPVRITPVFGRIWPIPLPQIGAVWVNFIAGYAAPLTAAGNNLTFRNWKTLAVGDVVRLSNSGGALPAPLQPKTDYYVESVVSPGTYTLAATAGGPAIALTDAGSGLNFVGEVPEGLLAWLKIRLSTIYENREEVAIMTRGKIDVLPYVDRLLDPYRSTVF